jgi:hypothetical protein
MKRCIGLVVLAIALSVGTAFAAEHKQGGLGFHDIQAPLGGRWWLNGDKIAIDAGLGFGSNEDVPTNTNLTHWALDLGVPIALKSWDRVTFIVRPGILYTSQEEIIGPPPPPVNTDNTTVFTFQGELEAEVFLADNFSVSAAQGFGISSTSFAGGGSASDWGTSGANFTNIGFHVYLFGEGGGSKSHR